MPRVTGDMAPGACGRIVYCGKQGSTARNCSGDRLNPTTGQDFVSCDSSSSLTEIVRDFFI